jgi:hypothetical protein
MDKDYPEAARVVALHLQEFCDVSLPYPAMIADASRKAADEIAELRQTLDQYGQNSECVHCGAPLRSDETDREHWKVCPEHPARQEIMRLQAAIDFAHEVAERGGME